jgi:UDP-N-acetylglucosamine 2-epimerase (non-hydrolysing)
MHPNINVRQGLLDEIKNYDGFIHLVLIGTKPDIIKQAPLILRLRTAGEKVYVVHSGQHNSWNLSKGMEEEFNIFPDVDLNVSGKLYEQQAQIIERFGNFLDYVRRINSKIIPYTYGDTTTAVAGGIASFANRIGVAHIEAGLRTMTPPKTVFDMLLKNKDVLGYFAMLREGDMWKKGSYEPYPEQFDTRAAAPSAAVHFSPNELNTKHLLEEGYHPNRVFIVGNPVVDSLDIARKRIGESKIFEQFPVLEQGDFIRMCIHRRENVTSAHRFKTLFKSMEDLILSGKNVLLISLGGTEIALEAFQLKNKIENLAKEHKNFIYSPVWPSYIDVVAALDKCSVVATDSGSMQEETNILGIPGVVLRFNTDRPESVFSGANIIAPPINSEMVTKIIKEVHENDELRKQMKNSPKNYGENVSTKIVSHMTKLMNGGPLFYMLEHDYLGYSKQDYWEKGESEW